MAFGVSDGKSESSIDFSKLSDGELATALLRINPARYPANLAACNDEIQSRKDRGVWREPPAPAVVGHGVGEAFFALIHAPRTHKVFAFFTLVGCLLLSPIMFVGILFGLAGSDSYFYVLIGLAYVGAVLLSIATLLDRKYVRWLLVCYAVGIFGLTMDARFWSQVNGDLCTQLRRDSKCLESADGFTCQNSAKYGNFVTSKSVCR